MRTIVVQNKEISELKICWEFIEPNGLRALDTCEGTRKETLEGKTLVIQNKWDNTSHTTLVSLSVPVPEKLQQSAVEDKQGHPGISIDTSPNFGTTMTKATIHSTSAIKNNN